MNNGRKWPPQTPAHRPGQQPTQAHRPGVLQPKAAARKVLQKKSSSAQPPANGATRVPAAPPVYGPQTPAVLQKKGAVTQPPRASQTRRQSPEPPPVYRPEPKKIVQPKAALQSRKLPQAPPVYRPASQSTTTLQAKHSTPEPSGAARKAPPQRPHPPSKTSAAHAGQQAPRPERLHAPRLQAAAAQPGAARARGPMTPPPTRPGVVQRLSIVLQPGDSIVEKSVVYSREVLGVDEVPVESFQDAKGTVGKSENIYLYGHGGLSNIALEEYDRFARMTTDNIAEQLAANVTFPKNYRGTIYLIGCKTDSLVNSLKSRLDELTGHDLDIRGTTDKLQEGRGGIVLRDRPLNAKTAQMREHVDMLRRYRDDLIGLRNLRRESISAVKTAYKTNDLEAKKEMIKKVYGTRHRINQKLTEVDDYLQDLASASSAKLTGRKKGLKELRKIYRKVKEAQDILNQSINDLLDLLGREKLEKEEKTRQEKKIAIQILQTLQSDREMLSDEISSITIVIKSCDSEDVLASRPFALSQMTGPKGGQSSSLSLSELTEVEPLIVNNPVVHQPARSNSCWPSCCCFLTTACVELKGLPDDCEELSVLRNFRDTYMLPTEEGRRLVGQYYEVAPGIVAAINRQEDAEAVYESVYEVVSDCVRDIKHGKQEEALERYKQMVTALCARYGQHLFRPCVAASGPNVAAPEGSTHTTAPHT